LANWSRTSAALRLLDEHAAAHGWFTDEGELRGFARFYTSLLNSERLALRALADHVRATSRDAAAALRAYVETNHA
jgi:hypothetical protein